MISEELESYAAVNHELPIEEENFENDIIRELKSQKFALVKAVILKMTILCQILSLLPLPRYLSKTFENLWNKPAGSLMNRFKNSIK
ncbi:hypothetical protein HZS_3569 [Henneguya salminicola]|nr:hypothetical protein HZS_3569 [Henneguya salminicola]